MHVKLYSILRIYAKLCGNETHMFSFLCIRHYTQIMDSLSFETKLYFLNQTNIFNCYKIYTIIYKLQVKPNVFNTI